VKKFFKLPLALANGQAAIAPASAELYFWAKARRIFEFLIRQLKLTAIDKTTKSPKY